MNQAVKNDDEFIYERYRLEIEISKIKEIASTSVGAAFNPRNISPRTRIDPIQISIDEIESIL